MVLAALGVSLSYVSHFFRQMLHLSNYFPYLCGSFCRMEHSIGILYAIGVNVDGGAIGV